MGEQLQANLGRGDAVKPNCEVEIYGLHTTFFVVIRMSSNLTPISGGVPESKHKTLNLMGAPCTLPQLRLCCSHKRQQIDAQVLSKFSLGFYLLLPLSLPYLC